MSIPIAMRSSQAVPEFDWGDIVSFWRRSALWIVLAAILGGIGCYAITLLIPNNYAASAVLLIDRPDASEITGATPAFRTDGVQRTFLLRSQMEVLHSDAIAAEVIHQLDLARDPAFASQPGLLSRLLAPVTERIELWLRPILAKAPATPPRPSPADQQGQLVERYLAALSTGAGVDNDIITLTYTARDPELAARILNAHLAAYLAWQKDQRREAVDAAYGWLRQAVPAAEKRVIAAEQTVQSYRTQHQIVALDGHTAPDQGLSQASTDLASAQSTYAHARARAEQIRTLQANGQIDGIIALSGSKLLGDLQASAVASAADVAGLEAGHGAAYPPVAAARAHLAQIRSGIAREIDNLVHGELSTADIAQATVTALKTALGQRQQDKLSGENASTELSRLENVARVEQSVYLDLLAKLRAADHVSDLQAGQATILRAATVPPAPASPKRGLFAAFGFLAFGGLAAAISVWRGGRRGVVRHTGDLTLVGGIDHVGVMPELRIDRHTGAFDRTDPRYFFFRQQLRVIHALLERGRDADKGSGIAVTITSCLPNEGKTSLAGELALFTAQSGLRTLLVNTDPKLRLAGASLADRPAPAAPDAPSSSQAATAGRHLPLDRVGLDIPNNVNNQSALAARINEWRQQYDVVVLDTPPVTFMADSIILAPAVDAILVTVRVDSTPSGLLATVVDQLERAGGHVAGAIMTFARLERQQGVLPSDPSYYFSNNRAYYRKLGSTRLLAQETDAQFVAGA